VLFFDIVIGKNLTFGFLCGILNDEDDEIAVRGGENVSLFRVMPTQTQQLANRTYLTLYYDRF
jgi:hypothetical protein